MWAGLAGMCVLSLCAKHAYTIGGLGKFEKLHHLRLTLRVFLVIYLCSHMLSIAVSALREIKYEARG